MMVSIVYFFDCDEEKFIQVIYCELSEKLLGWLRKWKGDGKELWINGRN